MDPDLSIYLTTVEVNCYDTLEFYNGDPVVFSLDFTRRYFKNGDNQLHVILESIAFSNPSLKLKDPASLVPFLIDFNLNNKPLKLELESFQGSQNYRTGLILKLALTKVDDRGNEIRITPQSKPSLDTTEHKDPIVTRAPSEANEPTNTTNDGARIEEKEVAELSVTTQNDGGRAKLCAQCGKKIKLADSKFCPYCGSKID